MAKSGHQHGFTLIEIVIVLAIASLIIAVLFFAISGAQQTSRDYQRSQALTQLGSYIQNYASNNAATFPPIPHSQADIDKLTTGSGPFANYDDPSTHMPYNVVYRSNLQPHDLRDVGGPLYPPGTIYYQFAHWCNRGPQSRPDSPSDAIAGDDTNMFRWVVWTKLENGAITCVDNSNGGQN